MQYLKNNNRIKICWITLVVLLGFNWAGIQHLPKMKLKDLNNKRQGISQYYKDGPILLNFWNLACEPCKKEMKELDKLNIKYRDLGFDYVSINIDSPRSMSKVKSYIKSQNFSFTVLSDPKAELFRKMGGKVMPFVIIADSTGAIINRHVGYSPGDEKKLEEEILHLLGTTEINTDTLLNKPIEPEPSLPTDKKVK